MEEEVPTPILSDDDFADDIDEPCDCDECQRARAIEAGEDAELLDDEDDDRLRYVHNFDALRVLDFTVAKGERYSRTLPFLGVELEVYAKKGILPERVMRATLDALPNFAILKHDGSLDDYRGFEIVTAPATFAAHKERWRPFFVGDAAPAKLLSSFSTERCGMHVHINRAALTPMHLTKLDVFINEPKNQPFIFNMADRTHDQMEQWAKFKEESGHPFTQSRLDQRRPQDRYTALNLMPPHTVEIRIFRGNVRAEGFWKNLEFAQAMYEYTSTASARRLRTDPFLSWVRHSKRFPHLCRCLVERNFLTK